jgi:AbrB family looped-hinge helix DNA binding protein
MIAHELVRSPAMATTTISSKFQIVIPKAVREKLHLRPRQHLHILEKGGVIALVPEVPLKSLKGALKGMPWTDLREKRGRL